MSQKVRDAMTCVLFVVAIITFAQPRTASIVTAWQSLNPWSVVFWASVSLLSILLIDRLHTCYRSIKRWGQSVVEKLDGLKQAEQSRKLTEGNLLTCFQQLQEDYRALLFKWESGQGSITK